MSCIIQYLFFIFVQFTLKHRRFKVYFRRLTVYFRRLAVYFRRFTCHLTHREADPEQSSQKTAKLIAKRFLTSKSTPLSLSHIVWPFYDLLLGSPTRALDLFGDGAHDSRVPRRLSILFFQVCCRHPLCCLFNIFRHWKSRVSVSADISLALEKHFRVAGAVICSVHKEFGILRSPEFDFLLHRPDSESRTLPGTRTRGYGQD